MYKENCGSYLDMVETSDSNAEIQFCSLFYLRMDSMTADVQLDRF